MERATSVFIWLSVTCGFLFGLFGTESRFVPALGGAIIFGAAAILIAGVVSVISAYASGAVRRSGHKGPSRPR